MESGFEGKLGRVQDQGDTVGLELRCEPRFEVNLPASVRLRSTARDGDASGVYTEAVCLQNLSQSGLQLQCSPALVSALLPKEPQGQEGLRRTPVEFDVYFDLPKGEGGQPVSLTCTLVYTRRIKAQRYLLGCNLSGFSKGSGEYLEIYLRSLRDGS